MSTFSQRPYYIHDLTTKANLRKQLGQITSDFHIKENSSRIQKVRTKLQLELRTDYQNIKTEVKYNQNCPTIRRTD